MHRFAGRNDKTMRIVLKVPMLYLARPSFIFTLIFAVSAAALAGAYGSQYIGGLKPCIMCLYQRIPFMTAGLLALIGMAVQNRAGAVNTILGLCTLAFAANACLALYHTGVELHWWESAVEGCVVSFGDEKKDLLQSIMGTPSVPCEAIQWKDPVLGLTMANYNAALCIVMMDICSLALILRLCRKRSVQP